MSSTDTPRWRPNPNPVPCATCGAPVDTSVANRMSQRVLESWCSEACFSASPETRR